jgi:hypothetical protein
MELNGRIPAGAIPWLDSICPIRVGTAHQFVPSISDRTVEKSVSISFNISLLGLIEYRT